MTTTENNRKRVLIITAFVLVAVGAVFIKYWDYIVNPWTRNGQVMAQVVEITPRVSGTIVDLPIVDNQFVKTGDLLFQVDPRTFQSEVDLKEAELDGTIDEIAALAAQIDASAAAVTQTEEDVTWYQQQVIGKKARLTDYQAEFKRYTKMLSSGASSRERVEQAVADVTAAEARLEGARAELRQAESANLQAIADLARDKANHGAYGDKNARLRRAKAAVHHSHLELEFTTVVAPVDGYITNMNMRVGDHATAKHQALALVDVESYWVYGFFKESYLADIKNGDLALVTLMSHPNKPIWGRVISKSWGVYQSDGSTKEELLPEVDATYEWIRLAQRVPVRVELGKLPEGVELVVGTTASVLVLKDSAENEAPEGVPPVPWILE